MIITCGWNRKVGRYWEHKNTAGLQIDLPLSAWEGDHRDIHAELNKHKRKEENYAL